MPILIYLCRGHWLAGLIVVSNRLVVDVELTYEMVSAFIRDVLELWDVVVVSYS